MPQRRARRTADQWQTLIDQQQSSGLSARSFCADHDLGYASFLQWRQRLEDHALPAFVEVTPDELSSPAGLPERSAPLAIDLDLGDGMTLSIRRG